MKNYRRIVRRLLGIGCLVAASSGHAAFGCYSLSTFEEVECLHKEYKSVDALLKQKVAQLIKMAAPRDMLGAPKERVDARRRELQDAIRRADVLWRESLKVECDTLVEASFGLGNGGSAGSLACRIGRTYDRIKFLSASEAYQWLWSR